MKIYNVENSEAKLSDRMLSTNKLMISLVSDPLKSVFRSNFLRISLFIFSTFFSLLTYTARAIFLHSPENENFENADLTKSFL